VKDKKNEKGKKNLRFSIKSKLTKEEMEGKILWLFILYPQMD